MRRLVVALVLASLVALSLQATAATIATSFPVGHQPFGVAVDPTDGRVFVANTGSNTVSVVNPSAGTVTSVDVGLQPGLLAVDGPARRLYVSNGGDKSLTVIDLTNLSVVTTIPVTGGLDVAADPAGHRAFVAGGNQLVVVNTLTNTVARTLFVFGGASLFGIEHDAVLQRVYATDINSAAPTLRVRNEDLSRITDIALPKPVRYAMAVNPVTHEIYLASEDPAGPPFTNSELYVVDPTTFQIVHTTPLGGFSAGMALSPSTHRIWVTDTSGKHLREIDDQTFAVVGTTDLPWEPAMLALREQDGRLYVAGNSADVLGGAVIGNVPPVNNPPVIDSVTLSPAAPHTDDPLQASFAAHDPDGDTLTPSFRWSRNGTVIDSASGPTLAAGAGARGDTISVEVTVSDGAATATASASVVIADSAPTVTVSLNEAAPTTNALLTATAIGSDLDARDSLTYTFTWKVNGVTREVATSSNPADGFDLSLAGNGDRGETLTVEAVASDGTLDSAAASASAVVANSAPTVTVSLSSTTPRKKDVLVATASGHDADGDALAFAYVWRVNGVVQLSVTTDRFDLRGHVATGDTVTVSVTASDGAATSAPATATATVRGGEDDEDEDDDEDGDHFASTLALRSGPS
ncbi:MAG TPA: hypothetical protein VGR87_03270 [Candidatus Limnocylindria bacterium]|jgi:YVTN family beta-propeller protein|nr:hypothetical protein [Candidatus Limnocylindria bacterium]